MERSTPPHQRLVLNQQTGASMRAVVRGTMAISSNSYRVMAKPVKYGIRRRTENFWVFMTNASFAATAHKWFLDPAREGLDGVQRFGLLTRNRMIGFNSTRCSAFVMVRCSEFTFHIEGEAMTHHKSTILSAFAIVFVSANRDSGSQKIDQNAQLGKGHLGPQDSASKGGVSADEHRANASGHGRNDPHALRGASGKRTPAGDSQKSPASDSRGQDATDQGLR
jgi:hypothetical protein